MKVIISHDIDHLHFSEHWRDPFVLKYLVRAKLEWLTGKIPFRECWARILRIPGNRIHNIPELMDYDAQMNIPSTFFIGILRGRGLNYSLSQAKKWKQEVHKRGFNTGVHGNAAGDPVEIKRERYLYLSDAGPENEPGIRMHYLHLMEDTKKYLSDAGYAYDSSEYAVKAPYRVGNMWEFPIQIMDTYEIEDGGRWQKNTLEQARQSSIRKIQQAENLNLPYLVVIFHDCYFSDSHTCWKNWYLWLTEYLFQRGHPFISFSDAVKELNQLGE